MSAARGEGRVVVVTGGTKGIGRALCEAFLQRGCRLGFCARNEDDVRSFEAELAARFGADRVVGARADVSVYEDNVALWDRCVARVGAPDLWIANAGTSNVQQGFTTVDPRAIAAVVGANFMGTLHGARVASERMVARKSGAIYTMEGYGSDGSRQRGMAIYGSTKFGLAYFTRALADELEGTGVIVGSLSPGVVLTDLLVDVYEQGEPAIWKRAKPFFKFIADPPETVAAWLADQVLANEKSGARFQWMTMAKAISRVFQPSFHRRDIVGEAINRRRDRTR